MLCSIDSSDLPVQNSNLNSIVYYKPKAAQQGKQMRLGNTIQ